MDGILADWASYTAIATHSVLIVLMCNGCGERTGKENLILNSMITAGWDLMQVIRTSQLSSPPSPRQHNLLHHLRVALKRPVALSDMFGLLLDMVQREH